MLTINNYFSYLKEIEVDKLPKILRESYEYVREITSDHQHWDNYHSDPEIRSVINRYFSSLHDHFAKSSGSTFSSKELEKKAHTYAKEAILNEAKRGYGLEYFKRAFLEAEGMNFDYQMKNGKIRITKVEKQEVDFVFQIPELYSELVIEGVIKSKNTGNTSLIPKTKSPQIKTIPAHNFFKKTKEKNLIRKK